MKILSVDTSATAASVALSEEDKLIGEFFINTSLTHSQTLIPMIEQLLKNTKTEYTEISCIAVNSGPGSFTGVRIGVAAVKGLAFANNTPCISVSTLCSMAYNMLGRNCTVCAVMDARCSQVYNALFKVNNGIVTRICDDRAMSMADLKSELSRIDDNIVLVGDGANIFFNFINNELCNIELAPVNLRYQRASSTALAAFEEYKNGNTLTAEELMPAYLRLPQAQRELNKKLGVKQ